MADYIDRDKVLDAILGLPPKMDEQGYGWLGRMGVWQMLSDFPSADVMTRDEGIRLGAELAAMHGSDATSQDLEKEYWRGFEDAMQKRDVVPVVHGRWIFHDDKPLGFKTECSVCHADGMLDGYYCPNCGAKMDLLN